MRRATTTISTDSKLVRRPKMAGIIDCGIPRLLGNRRCSVVESCKSVRCRWSVSVYCTAESFRECEGGILRIHFKQPFEVMFFHSIQCDDRDQLMHFESVSLSREELDWPVEQVLFPSLFLEILGTLLLTGAWYSIFFAICFNMNPISMKQLQKLKQDHTS